MILLLTALTKETYFNSLFFKSAGAKAPIAPVLNMPMVKEG